MLNKTGPNFNQDNSLLTMQIKFTLIQTLYETVNKICLKCNLLSLITILNFLFR